MLNTIKIVSIALSESKSKIILICFIKLNINNVKLPQIREESARNSEYIFINTDERTDNNMYS